MGRKTTGLISAILAATTFGAAQAQTRIVTSDATAQFMALELGKFIVIELPTDVTKVIVADPKIVNVMLQTLRQATIMSVGRGQTAVAFYDADNQPIDALNITVEAYQVPTRMPIGPVKTITILRGTRWTTLSCTTSTNLSEEASCFNREEDKKDDDKK